MQASNMMAKHDGQHSSCLDGGPNATNAIIGCFGQVGSILEPSELEDQDFDHLITFQLK